MIKSYIMKHEMNIGKQNSLKLLIKEYRKTAINISKFHWKSIFNKEDCIQETPKQFLNRKIKFIKNKSTIISTSGNLKNIPLNPYLKFPFKSKFNKNLKLNVITKLSARYQQTCSYQVVGILDSYLENRKNNFVKIVYNNFKDENLRISLLYINKYKRLVNKFRSFLENEINRVINKIVNNHSLKTIIIENLDFRSPDLSKRINRLLSNYGKRFLNKKFIDLEEDLGINVVEIRAEYSSTECSSCGYVSKSNRVKQEIFKCGFCKKSLNADYNASINIFKRSSLKLFLSNSYVTRKELLYRLNKRFIETKLTFMYENAFKYGNNRNAKTLTKKLLKNNYINGNSDFKQLLVRFESIL